MRLERKLKECGCGHLDAEELRDVVQEVATSLAPSVSWWQRVDYIQNAPNECGRPFVKEVRRRMDCNRLPERVIMETLVNIRKRSLIVA